jgi:hypothetical protein
MLTRFPLLGTVPSLLENWPSLKLAVEKKEEELGKSLSDAIISGEVSLPDPAGKGVTPTNPK